jgi:septum site-determining protein MinC
MNQAPAGASAPAVELRFGPVGLAQVRIRTLDPDVVQADLAGRAATAPKMFERMPVALDLNELAAVPEAGAMRPVVDAIRRAGFLPIGLARGSDALETLARELDLPVLMQFRASRAAAADDPAAVPRAGVPMTPGAAAASRRRGLQRPPDERDTDAAVDLDAGAAESAPIEVPSPAPAAAPPPAPAAEARPSTPSLMHAQTVRSGQRVYARHRDLVVTAPVASGAEVMADGNVHVYGSLRGRAMAGTRGDAGARVFCQEFHAELVSIAGVFRLFETIPPELEGKPVQAWLDGDDLRFARIG